MYVKATNFVFSPWNSDLSVYHQSNFHENSKRITNIGLTTLLWWRYVQKKGDWNTLHLSNIISLDHIHNWIPEQLNEMFSWLLILLIVVTFSWKTRNGWRNSWIMWLTEEGWMKTSLRPSVHCGRCPDERPALRLRALAWPASTLSLFIAATFGYKPAHMDACVTLLSQKTKNIILRPHLY